jgi:hypothetical protein
MSRYIESHSTPDEKIFGDSSTTPLLALQTNRSIALNEADTNAKRFLTNTSDLASLLGQLETDPPTFLIVRPDAYLDTLSIFREYKENHYHLSQGFLDISTMQTYEIWERSKSED